MTASARPAPVPPPPAPQPSVKHSANAAASGLPELPESLARILRLHVPVIVRLAERKMTVGVIRGLSVGAILEFEKSVEEDLELLVNNRRIGRGTCVKVGENFGLRLNQVGDATQRVRSLGGAD